MSSGTDAASRLEPLRAQFGQIRQSVAARPLGGAESGSALPARALGLLYVAGATIGMISLLLPMPRTADLAGLWSNVGLAYAGGIMLLALGARIPRWFLHITLAAGTGLIARAVFLSGDPVSFYSVWFIWVGLYSFYFLSRPAAIAHVLFVFAMYGWTLLDGTTNSPVGRYLTTVLTLIVAGGFIDTLVRRARREASAAAASADMMARVAAVAHELAGVSESAAARPALCAAAARVTHADGIALWEPTSDGGGLALMASAGWRAPESSLAFAGPPAGLLQAFAMGTAISTRQGSNTACLEFAGEPEPPGAVVWQPVLRDQRAVAVLACYWRAVDGADDESIFSLTDLLSAETAVTLERLGLLARLEEIARTDELTGLPNRRAWLEGLTRELSRAERTDEPLCVAMLDLDHFKRYNDRRGHQAGDRLLRGVAGAWVNELRATDVLVRYGGEEFALALPGCEMAEAFATVERLRGAVPMGETCSAGIALWDGQEMGAELLERADSALYLAKRTGRDQTCVAQLNPAVSPSDVLKRFSSSSSIE